MQRYKILSIVNQVYSTYEDFINDNISIDEARNKITSLVKSSTGIISIFPNNLPFIHINTILGTYNLLITLTLSQVSNNSIILICPNLTISEKPIENNISLEYSVLPIWKGESIVCPKRLYYIVWEKGNKVINIHPGDTLIIKGMDNGQTFTSCDERRTISISPVYDLMLSQDQEDIKITFQEIGNFFFTSRPQCKSFLLQVVVNECICSN